MLPLRLIYAAAAFADVIRFRRRRYETINSEDTINQTLENNDIITSTEHIIESFFSRA